MPNLKYIIYNEPLLAAGNKIFSCGGGIALYSLFNDLKKIGEKTYLSHRTEQFVPGLEPFIEEDFFNENETPLEDCVTIYPEITSGNPTNSKHVVRWLLHYPDYHFAHVSETWREKDLLFAFSRWQDLESKKRKFNTQGILTCLHTNLETFRDYNEKRAGSCYIRRKNLNRNFNINLVPQNSVCVEEILNSGNERDIANCLNSYEYFYSYDENTYFSILAALCGCISVVVTDNENQKSWYENRPYFKDAVAYGDENIDHVKKNMHLIKTGIITSKKQNLKTVENFISLTKEICHII